MKYNLSNFNFDSFFKVALITLSAYFLVFITLVAIHFKDESGVGRYKFNKDGLYILDTKTGKVKPITEALK